MCILAYSCKTFLLKIAVDNIHLYDVLIQAVSQGHIMVEAASPEEAKAAAIQALFTGNIHWESTRMEFPGIDPQKA